MLARYFLVAVMLILGASPSFAQDSAPVEPEGSSLTADQLLGVVPGDIVFGNKDAKVTIIEYASMTCSHCAAFHNNTFPELKEKYIDTGKIKYVFRDFPLDEVALRGSMMARCAAKSGDENFLKFVKVMFSTQSNWASKKNYLEVLSNIGKLGGMKGEDFDKCMADKELEKSIMTGRFDASKKLDVRSTPTFFLNKEMLRGGHDIAYLSNAIDTLLGTGPVDATKPAPDVKN